MDERAVDKTEADKQSAEFEILHRAYNIGHVLLKISIINEYRINKVRRKKMRHNRM